MADPELEQTIGARFDAGDLPGAATALIRGYGPEILSYLHAVTHNEIDAREVFAEASEDLWRGLAGFRRECSFRTWTYTITWHAAVRHATDAFRQRGQRLDTTEATAIAAEVYSRTPAHLQTAARDRLRKLRKSLSADEQSLLVLRINRGLAWTEIARVMSAPAPAAPLDEATLRKRFERLKERLRALAEAEGLLGDERDDGR